MHIALEFSDRQVWQRIDICLCHIGVCLKSDSIPQIFSKKKKIYSSGFWVVEALLSRRRINFTHGLVLVPRLGVAVEGPATQLCIDGVVTVGSSGFTVGNADVTEGLWLFDREATIWIADSLSTFQMQLLRIPLKLKIIRCLHLENWWFLVKYCYITYGNPRNQRYSLHLLKNKNNYYSRFRTVFVAHEKPCLHLRYVLRINPTLFS